MTKPLALLLLLLTAISPKSSAQLVNAGDGMRALIERYSADHGSIHRSYPLNMSAQHRERIGRFLREWRSEIDEINTSAFSQDDRVDHVLFKNHLDHELRDMEIREKRLEEIIPFLPFSAGIIRLDEERRAMHVVNPEAAASVLNGLLPEIEKVKQSILKGLDPGKGDENVNPLKATKIQANRAAGECQRLRRILKDWYSFYEGYDPLFTWWVQEPYKRLDKALGANADFLREEVVGIKGNDQGAIIGDPIGREALLSELEHEMISYSPEELVRIAEKEYAWCETEMKKASHDLGFGDDWLKAVEHVKTLHETPGGQPELIRGLAYEAIEFLEARDLLTIPPLAKESWRIEMMSAERQKVSPFFTGGEVISVAFPLDSMQHEQKLMSLRGNNIHFSRATVHHELIPGHHLQGFMMDRYRTYRHVFWTPFWLEGWALYWEMQLWDLGFPQSPENKVGMLFWRMHRCARIIFSLNFHLGKMTPQECIDMLVKRVGHEVDNATAEVRRSFGGDYPPLYQAAYMLGALQFRALYKELVDGGKMSAKEFHDRILAGNVMPVEMVRVLLGDKEIGSESDPGWRFYPGLE